ncbi:MAG: TonB-dependent receptor [Lysobacterales bacterium]
MAISAFGQLELEAAGFVDIVDISKATPGLFVEDFNQSFARVNSTPRFRGVFLSTGNRLQQTATVFLDGIYMSGGIQTVGINELERVEVIKGPQSALFGRNTFAGAINYVTKDPADEFSVDLDLQSATRGEFRGAVGVEGPISDTLSYRLGAMVESNDGHYDNNAVDGQTLGDEAQWAVNASLMFEPTDRFSLRARASYREIEDGAPAAVGTAGVADHNFGGFALNNGIGDINDSVFPVPRADNVAGLRTESVFRGTIRSPADDNVGLTSGFSAVERFRQGLVADGRYAITDAINDFKYNPLNTDGFGLNLDELRFSVRTNFAVTDSIDWQVLAGYNEEQYGYWSDFDLRPGNSFQSFIAQEIDDLSFETRLNGLAMDDRLNWTVGLSYVDIEIRAANGTASFFGPSIYFGDIFRSDPFVTGAKTTGIFGSVDYQINDNWAVTLEGRYQEDEIIDQDVNNGLPQAISPSTLDNFLPRLTARYQPNDDATFYFTYSEGNLPGGFNPQVGGLDDVQRAALEQVAPGTSITFDEESLKNYEFGWKQVALDGRLSVNTAVFFMERSDEIFRSIELVPNTDPSQDLAQITVAFNANGASTDIYGIEIDAAWVATENLSFQASLGYVDATIASFPEGAGSGDFGDIFGQGVSVEGQEAPRFPPLSGSLSATWESPFSGGGTFDTWYVRGDTFYTGNYYASNANVAEADTAVDTNLRAGLRGDTMSVELFATNLFDEDAPTAANNFADVGLDTRVLPGGFFDFSREGIQVGLRDKRQVGLRFRYSFQ